MNKSENTVFLDKKILKNYSRVEVESDLLDSVDTPLIGLCNEQSTQVGQSDGLGSLQGGAHCCPTDQMVVNTRNLAVDRTSCHNTHLKAFWHLEVTKKQTPRDAPWYVKEQKVDAQVNVHLTESAADIAASLILGFKPEWACLI